MTANYPNRSHTLTLLRRFIGTAAIILISIALSNPPASAQDDTNRLEPLIHAINQTAIQDASKAFSHLPNTLTKLELDRIEQSLEPQTLNLKWVPFLKSLCENHPNRGVFRIYWANALIDSGGTDNAMRILKETVERHRDNTAILHRAALLAYSKQRYVEAGEWVSRLLELNPSHLDGLFLHGCIQSRQGDIEAGRRTLLQVLRIAPKHRLALYELGLLENRAGSNERAERYLLACIRQQPFFLEAYNALLISLARQRKKNEIQLIQPISRYLKTWNKSKLMRLWYAFNHPSEIPTEGALELAREFCAVKREDLAQSLLEKRIEQGTADDSMVIFLAQILQNRKDYTRCLKVLDRIQDKNRRQSELYATLKGWSLFQSGQIGEAWAYYEEMAYLHKYSRHFKALKKALDESSTPRVSKKQPSQPKPDPPPKTNDKPFKKSVSIPLSQPETSALELTSATHPETVFHFVDVTEKAGLSTFKHRLGHKDKRWILDAMGSGVAVGDYDNDGDDDIYLVNGRPDVHSPDPAWRNALFRNDNGRFTNVTQQSGVGDMGMGMCAVFGDIDNDGWLDLFVGNFGKNALYRNNGDRTFSDITDQAGIKDSGYTAAASFADIDRDGDLDLFVGNYVDFDPVKHSDDRAELHGIEVFPHPLEFGAQRDCLYLNDGQGVFTDATEKSGVNPSLGRAMGSVFFDLENDGDLDLYITNDTTYNFVLQNRGDGTFDDISYFSGGAFTETGVEGASMGVSAGDFDNDGFFDLHITSYAWQTDCLFLNDGQEHLIDFSGQAGLLQPSYKIVTWGNLWNDFDADGRLDLFTANGHLYPQVERLAHLEQSYNQGVSFYRNQGRRFTHAPSSSRLENFEPKSSRGAALLDYDSDGDMDIILNCIDSAPQLLENRTEAGHSLTVVLKGTSAETFGARVVARKGNQTWTRMVDGGSGYLSQSTSTLHFGFGTISAIDDLTVHWPHSEPQVIQSPPLDRLLTVVPPQPLHPK